MSVNSRLKAKIIGQRKVFYRQRIPESVYVRKQTNEIGILIRSTMVIRKSCNLSESHENRELEPVERVQMIFYQSNTYRKNLTWLNQWLTVTASEEPTILHICFLAYLTFPSSSYKHHSRCDNSTSYKVVWYIYKGTV